jgi:hypothetical protein
MWDSDSKKKKRNKQIGLPKSLSLPSQSSGSSNLQRNSLNWRACYQRLIGFWCRFSRVRTRVVGHPKSRECHGVPLHSTLWTVDCLINIYYGNLKILTLLEKSSLKKLNLFSYYYFRFDFLLRGIGWGENVRFIQFEVLDSNSIGDFF